MDAENVKFYLHSLKSDSPTAIYARFHLYGEEVKISIGLKVHPDLWDRTTQFPTTEKTIIKEWYRKQLKNQIPELLEKWDKVIDVKSNDWGVKQMRTKWEACNIEAKRSWLNLELIKKPTICLEYIIFHELAHLLERHHNDRFVAYMDKFMPKWRLYRDQLIPVAHGGWEY